jgi:hypothetical protein
MKKVLTTLALAFSLVSLSNAATGIAPAFNLSVKYGEKFDIKIKNDSGDEVTVYNAGSGGTYRLTKNATTTIKMEAGDKLYYYEGGKKGRLLLTAEAGMNGKVQLYSKL